MSSADTQASKPYIDGTKKVGSAAVSLVSLVKAFAAKSPESSALSDLIQASKGIAVSATQLIVCAEGLAAFWHHPECNNQLRETLMGTGAAIEKLVGSVDHLDGFEDQAALGKLVSTASTVLDDLLFQIQLDTPASGIQSVVTALRDDVSVLADTNSSAKTIAVKAKSVDLMLTDLLTFAKSLAKKDSDSLKRNTKSLVSLQKQLPSVVKNFSKEQSGDNRKKVSEVAAQLLSTISTIPLTENRAVFANLLILNAQSMYSIALKLAVPLLSNLVASVESVADSGIGLLAESALDVVGDLAIIASKCKVDPINAGNLSDLVTACKVFKCNILPLFHINLLS